MPRFCTRKSWTMKRLASTGPTRVLAPAPAASGRVRSNRRGNHESILGSLDHDILFFRTGHVAPNAGAQEHHHATGGRHRIPRHRHQPARCRGLGHDAELFRPPLHVRFINDPSSCGDRLLFKILYYRLVLEKQEKFDGHQQFFAIVQLIGTRKQAENFAYR